MVVNAKNCFTFPLKFLLRCDHAHKRFVICEEENKKNYGYFDSHSIHKTKFQLFARHKWSFANIKQAE